MSNKVSIIIPAHNEGKYLNKTIDNFYAMSTGEIEVIVILNGYDQEVDKRAKVFRYQKNMGERVAMNTAASIATGKYLFRIDGHCSIEPKGWDEMMVKEMSDKKILVAVITAINNKWEKIPGHWYGFCKLLPTMEEKWLTKKNYNTIEKNMALTGCGFMITKEFYDSFGGADEALSSMGAIGPEFALRGWLDGEGCYTHTQVMIGHIFNTGGYNLDGVTTARERLRKKYGNRYNELLKHFPQEDIMSTKVDSVDQKKRMVTIHRKDEHVTKDKKGNVLKKVVEHFKYVHEDNGKGLTPEEIEKKYSSEAKKVGEDVYFPNQKGELVLV